ncbi:MAG: ATP-binding protein [Candidatus Auribacterota bacterium]
MKCIDSMTVKRNQDINLSHIDDPRILQYIHAAQRMLQEDFSAPVPVDKNDQIGLLGKSLSALGSKLHKQISMLREIVRVTKRINEGMTIDEVLNHVYDNFRKYIPFDRIGFSLITPDAAVQARWARSDGVDIKLGVGYELPLHKTSLQKVMDSGKPRIINNLKEYHAHSPQSESTKLILSEGIQSSLTCPLIANKPLGFIFFSSKEKCAYENVHVDIFLQLAGELSMILEKACLYEQLIALNQLKDKFIGYAAHDLRNPLMIIKGFISLIQSTPADKATYSERDVYSRIDRQCDRMIDLINDLLDISAIESGELHLDKESASIQDVIEEVVDTNNFIAQAKQIIIRTNIHGALKPVWADQKRIVQVLENLISNAIKFSQAGSVITVSACVLESHVAVSVADQGQGISDDEIHNLFQPFMLTSTKPTGEEHSTGLGLAIVKKIVNLHGGQITVKSKVGEGSTFTFTLPLYK